MTTKLVSDRQMEAIRGAAKLGMQTPVVIERRGDAPPPVGGDYGDDFIDYTVTTESRRNTVLGWFRSTPTPVQEVDFGQVVTVNTYRLIVPVGTDIEVGDHVIVGDHNYTVSDTTAESTWLPHLTASLRKRD